MAGSRTTRSPKHMVGNTDVATKWAAQDAATALVQTNLTTHEGTATIHRSINDAGVAVTDLWSADKITTMLAGKAATPLVIGDFPDDTITPPKLDIDNAEVDTYVLSYDLGTTSFKWVERAKVDLTNVAAASVTEALLAIFTAPGAGVDNFAICWDNGNTRLDYMEMMLPDISNLSVEIPESVLEVISHATALEDGYALAWNNAAGKMEWTDISAIVGADTYKVKWDAADVAEYLGLKLPKPTTGSGYELYMVNSDFSAIALGPMANPRNYFRNPECLVDQRNVGVATTIAHGSYVADLWRAYLSNLDELVATSKVSEAAVVTSRSGLKIDVTTPETSLAVAGENFVPLYQLVRGCTELNSMTITISFWFLSDCADGTVFSIAVHNSAGNRAYVTDFTYVSSGVSQFVQKTIVMEAASVDFSIDALTVYFFGCGGSGTATINSWHASSAMYSTAASRWAEAAKYIKVSELSLITGATVCKFHTKSYTDYLQDCLQYYRKSYAWNVAPGAGTTTGCLKWKNTAAAAAIDAFVPIRFDPPMAGTPTITLYSTTGAPGNIRNETGAADIAATAADVTDTGSSYVDTGAVTIGTLHIVSFHYVAVV